MTSKTLDEVQAPEEVAQILEATADVYNADAMELTYSWQDPYAGAPWLMVAELLERCASEIRERMRKRDFEEYVIDLDDEDEE